MLRALQHVGPTKMHPASLVQEQESIAELTPAAIQQYYRGWICVLPERHKDSIADNIWKTFPSMSDNVFQMMHYKATCSLFANNALQFLLGSQLTLTVVNKENVVELRTVRLWFSDWYVMIQYVTTVTKRSAANTDFFSSLMPVWFYFSIMYILL